MHTAYLIFTFVVNAFMASLLSTSLRRSVREGDAPTRAVATMMWTTVAACAMVALWSLYYLLR